jgi:Zn-finger nucleic acid-binding protein
VEASEEGSPVAEALRVVGKQKEHRMHCPKCVSSQLKQYKIEKKDVAVDACPRCRGVWFDAEEISEVLAVACKELQIPKSAEPTGMTCPKCLIPLETFNYPQTHVKIEMCGKCMGFWLDQGEFKEIKAVRERLERKGEMEAFAPVTGIKGTILAWVNRAIDGLSDFD